MGARKSSKVNPKYKTKYRVGNWREYERGLRSRCDVTIWQRLNVKETVPRCSWAEAFYRQQRAKGAGHRTAMRALAYKWIRIMYRCWKDRTEYDEAKYLKALAKRGSPLLRAIAPSPQSLTAHLRA